MKKTFALDLTVTQRAQLTQGLELLTRGDPYAAHESFEAGFRAAEGPNQTLFRGLTQLAAAYHQLCLGRGRASRSTLTKAFRNLELVDLLSTEFQNRVERLFVSLGAQPNCARFIPIHDASQIVWPAPAGLHPVT
ncbi:MAG TPA: DUF309 domain-containing protein [Polyangiales bacterium]